MVLSSTFVVQETSSWCGATPFSEETLATNIRCFFALQMHLEILWSSFTNEQKCNSLCLKQVEQAWVPLIKKEKKISKKEAYTTPF